MCALHIKTATPDDELSYNVDSNTRTEERNSMGTILTIIIVIGVIWLITQLAGSVIGLVIWLAVAGFAGYLASRVAGGDGVGTVGNILLGLVGGLIGPVILSLVNLQGLRDNFLGGLIASFIGAVVVIFVGRMFGNKSFGK